MLEGSDLMKRIVLCADGTWNVRDQVDKASNTRRPTNVTKVARAVRPRASNGTDQAVFYHEGVGTAGGLDRYTGGAFGEGIEANIRELYRFLVYNYEPGDELYFFGFRRGAFTVRTLAGLMNKVGLVQKDDDYYVPELYACYEGSKGPGSPEWIKAFHNIKVPRPCPPIRFIGVWDTVGALGAPGFLGQFLNKDKYKYKYKYKYHDVGLNPHIRERLSCPCHRRTAQALPAQDGLANEALHWMVEKAERLGLVFDANYLQHFTPCFNSLLQDSMTTTYKALGQYVRPIGRQPVDGEAFHKSTIDRRNLAECNYHPENLEYFIAK